MSRIGIKLPMLVGLAAGSLGLFALLATGEHRHSYWLLVLPLIAMGFGISLYFLSPSILNNNPTTFNGWRSGCQGCPKF